MVQIFFFGGCTCMGTWIMPSGGDRPGHMSKPDPSRDCVAAPGNHAGEIHDGRYNGSNASVYRIRNR